MFLEFIFIAYGIKTIYDVEYKNNKINLCWHTINQDYNSTKYRTGNKIVIETTSLTNDGKLYILTIHYLMKLGIK